MDFVEGEVLEPLEDPSRIEQVAAIDSHISTFRRT